MGFRLVNKMWTVMKVHEGNTTCRMFTVLLIYSSNETIRDARPVSDCLRPHLHSMLSVVTSTGNRDGFLCVWGGGGILKLK